MADLLVTGGNGQLGSALRRCGRRQGIAVDSLDRAALDITDRNTTLNAVAAAKPGVIVNAAAYTAVDRAEDEPDAAFAVNRDGAGYLAEAAEAAGIPIIHISTDYVFDGGKSVAYREDDPVAPLGVYGASKLAGEERVREACSRHVILRTAWVYGVDGHNFVKTMLRLAGDRPTLRVVADQVGAPTYADDLANAVIGTCRQIAAAPTADALWGTFHCVGGGATSWHGLASEVFALAGDRIVRRPRVDAITTAEFPTRARRPANSVLDCGRFADTYGITLRPWQPALKDMLDALFASDRQENANGQKGPSA